ncbi:MULTISPECIES: ATP-binding cassette domain-containing protein [Caproicibacterium]|uniref:ATP-binding cassette domain-containing protein n=1 Tax=Caproicibacterium argilliputei TaxID=3030016 RepID=A0AA97H126_9FIRM|nr:ATP-binding cassette domain-containing protein [Caproicibacterium argilliputei]WOC32191.1 ATP-binding cassette domain-containing protein [Caproicibacterium argilliputei]
MIEVSHLTKRYGPNIALQDVSFAVEGNGVVGFLGPNGAGKSTTMNIITGYLSATSGTVVVEGHDVLEEPDDAKSCLGYLPEMPPLYLDMTVEEYLSFLYDLKKVKKSKQEHIGQVCRRTGIDHVYTRLIGNLSKGYRQRVGLAQALLGDPPVLILDEPTVGLDPKQIIEIRNLIKTLGKNHTVILSSHILQEIEATCDRILIVNNGRLVADGTQEELAKTVEPQRLMVEIEAPKDTAEKALRALPHVEGIEPAGESEPGIWRFALKEHDDARREVFHLCCDKNWTLISMSARRNTLEDIFLRLTSNTVDDRGDFSKKPKNKKVRKILANAVDYTVPTTDAELSRKEKTSAAHADAKPKDEPQTAEQSGQKEEN